MDPEFSEDGLIRTNIGYTGSEGISGALQVDGKILFAGYAWGGANNDYDFGIGRLLPNGRFDSTFSEDGRLLLDLGSTADLLKTVLVRPDGKIMVFGSSQTFNPAADILVLVQLNSDGARDTTFGNNGVVKTSLTGQDHPSGMRVLPDGKILTVSYGSDAQSEFILLAQYLENGQADSSFSFNGVAVDELLNFDARAYAIDIQLDGKIVVAGYSLAAGNHNYVLRRYWPDGSLDTEFGVNGLVTGDFSSQTNSKALLLTILPDGKILVVGQAFFPFENMIARFNPDGSLDSAFGVNGVLPVAVSGYNLSVNAISALSDGKILISGGIFKTDNTGHNFYVARLLEHGAFDPSFGVNGVQQAGVLPDGSNQREMANALLVQPDGKIILIGTAESQVAITRHLTELNVGLLDFTAEAVAPLIYPNPIVETATLQYELSEATTITVELYDLQGKRILTLLPETEQAEGKHEVPVTLPHLASGAYVLSVSNGKGRVAVQVIKQ